MKTTKKLLFQGADEAFVYTTQTKFHVEGDLQPHLILTSDEGLAREVIRITKTMRELTKTKGQLFHWQPRVTRQRQPLHRPPQLAEDFLRILCSSLWWVRKAFPNHHLHPLVELFEKHMEARSFSGNFRPVCLEDVERLNACVKAIRADAKTKAFHRRLDKHHELVGRNSFTLLTLIDRLFSHYSQLLVVGMDICYRRDPLNARLSLPITETEAKAQCAQMIQYLRGDCKFNPLSYAWKLEFTEHTGWHTHLLLFFDPNLHQDDLVIAEHIGQHWNRVISGGNGCHFICNYEPSTCRGVGKIHHADVAKLWALWELAAANLTSVDYYARMVLPKRRTFGCSQLPDAPAKKRGRPRALTSARVADFVPPTLLSSANGKKQASTKRRLSVKTKAIVQPISPPLFADLGAAWFKSSFSRQDGLGADEGRSDETAWVV